MYHLYLMSLIIWHVLISQGITQAGRHIVDALQARWELLFLTDEGLEANLTETANNLANLCMNDDLTPTEADISALKTCILLYPGAMWEDCYERSQRRLLDKWRTFRPDELELDNPWEDKDEEKVLVS